MADCAGIHVQTVSRYERAVQLPKLEALQAWSDRYGVRIEWLLTGDGPIDYVDPAAVQDEIVRLFSGLSTNKQRDVLERLRMETMK